MIPVVLTRSLRWKFTTFQWCTLRLIRRIVLNHQFCTGMSDSIVCGQWVGQESRICSQWGATAEGNPPTTMVPLSVPLMWAAAGHEFSSPLFCWLNTEAHSVRDIQWIHEGSEEASTEVRHGWVALREAMRALGVEMPSLKLVGSSRFPQVFSLEPDLSQSSGVHSARSHARDARVALLERVYVLITLQHGREGAVPIQQTDVRPVVPRSGVAQVGEIPSASWEQLDQVNLDVPPQSANDEILSRILRGLVWQGIATRRSVRGSCSALFLFCCSIGPNTVARLAGMNLPSVQTM